MLWLTISDRNNYFLECFGFVFGKLDISSLVYVMIYSFFITTTLFTWFFPPTFISSLHLFALIHTKSSILNHFMTFRTKKKMFRLQKIRFFCCAHIFVITHPPSIVENGSMLAYYNSIPISAYNKRTGLSFEEFYHFVLYHSSFFPIIYLDLVHSKLLLLL